MGAGIKGGRDAMVAFELRASTPLVRGMTDAAGAAVI
jgi:hypothetical protein